MIVLDTTLLTYAVGAEHRLRAPCREVIDLARSGQLHVTTTVEVIQEFTHVRARRRGRRDAVTVARDYALVLAPLLTLDADDLQGGLALFAEQDALDAFDAVLAGAAMRRGAEALISADRVFAQLGALRHLDPAAATFHAELGRLR